VVGADEHGVNENLLVVGDTSSGRKGMALSQVRAVMASVDPEWAATRALSGLSTGEGLTYAVRDPRNYDIRQGFGRYVVRIPGVWRKRGEPLAGAKVEPPEPDSFAECDQPFPSQTDAGESVPVRDSKYVWCVQV
jgi:hypothetical protein